MSTIAIDTGTNRVNENDAPMLSVLNHKRIDDSGGTERSHKRTDNSRGTERCHPDDSGGTERSHNHPQGNKKLTLERTRSSTSKETHFVTPSNPSFTKAKGAAVGGEGGGGDNDGVKDNDDGCDSPPTPTPNGKKRKAVFDELEVTYTHKRVGEPKLSLGAAVSSVKCIFNKSDSDDDSNDSFNNSDSDNDSDDNNDNSDDNSNGDNNSDDVDGDSNDGDTSRLTRLNLIKTLAEKLGVLKCQHITTDLKHEAELDGSTIIGEEESSMYHILKGTTQWVINLGRMSIHFATMRISISEIEYFDRSIWKNHDNTRKRIYNDLPTVKPTPIKLAIYVDVSDTRDTR